MSVTLPKGEGAVSVPETGSGTIIPEEPSEQAVEAIGTSVSKAANVKNDSESSPKEAISALVDQTTEEVPEDTPVEEGDPFNEDSNKNEQMFREQVMQIH